MTKALSYPTPFSVREGFPEHRPRRQRPAPLPVGLLLSMLTQSTVLITSTAMSLAAERYFLASTCVMALCALALIASLLATKSRSCWMGARHGSLIGICVFVGTMCAATASSLRPGMFAVLGCLLLIQYRLALTSRSAHAFFAGGAAASADLATVDRRRKRRGRPASSNHWWRRFKQGLSLSIVAAATCLPCHAADGTQPTLEELLAQLPAEFAQQGNSVIKLLERYRSFAESHKIAAQKDLLARLNSSANRSGAVSHETLAIRTTLDWLEGSNSPPQNVAAMVWITSYAETLIKRQAPVWKQLGTLMIRLKKAGHIREADMLHTAFRRLEAGPDASEFLLDGKQFTGYRTTTDGKKTIPLLFKLSGVFIGDEKFTGRVERDFMYRGHPVHHCSGTFNGCLVTIQTESVKTFGSKTDHPWTYSGCLLGKSLIGRYSGVDKSGKPQGGLFLVRTEK